jgi:hypothetical protein
MVLLKIGLFVLLVVFLIKMSNEDRELNAELDHLFEVSSGKTANRSSGTVSAAFILIGCAIAVYFMPFDKVGLTGGTVLGVLIAAIATVSRSGV